MANKERVVVYLRKEIKQKLDANILNFEKSTLSNQVNELLEFAFEKKLDIKDESILNSISREIVNKINKNTSDLIEKLIEHINYQSEIIQAYMKSIKLYNVANNKQNEINNDLIQEKKSQFIEDTFKKDIELINKKHFK